MPYLIQKNTDGSTGEYWNLRDGPLTVGRGDKADVRIDDQEMSRQHFRIHREGETYLLEDLSSQNGTFVNDKRVTKTALNSEDRISAGKSHFLFVEGMVTMVGKAEQQGQPVQRTNTFIGKPVTRY